MVTVKPLVPAALHSIRSMRESPRHAGPSVSRRTVSVFDQPRPDGLQLLNDRDILPGITENDRLRLHAAGAGGPLPKLPIHLDLAERNEAEHKGRGLRCLVADREL